MFCQMEEYEMSSVHVLQGCHQNCALETDRMFGLAHRYDQLDARAY